LGALEEKISAAIRENPSSLKVLRRRAGITQKELARKVNVSQSLISKIERGKTTPSPILLNEISKVLADRLQSIEVKAGDIMRELTEVKPSDSLYKICDLLLKGRRVILDGKCITYKSMIQTVMRNPGIPLTAISAADAVEEAVLVEEDESIIKIAEILLENEIVIVSRKGAIVGAITKEDIARTLKRYGGIPVKGGV